MAGRTALIVKPRGQLAAFAKVRGMLATINAELSAAVTVDDAIRVRGKASVAEKICREAALGVELLNEAAEVKLRAERRAGQFLHDQIPHRGGRPRKNGNSSLPFSLTELGIGKMQSSRWQRAAKVPGETFDKLVQEHKDSRKELTTASVLKLAKRLPSKGRRYKKSVVTGKAIVESLAELDGQKFGTIYCYSRSAGAAGAASTRPRNTGAGGMNYRRRSGRTTQENDDENRHHNIRPGETRGLHGATI